MSTNQTTIHTFITETSADMAGLADYLDHLSVAARLHEVRALVNREQALLFEAAGTYPLNLTHFVSAGTPSLHEVVHGGRNSLPIYHTFEKRFCRPDTHTDELWGYNEHALRALIGPGYFIARMTSPQEVLFDYTIVPPAKLVAWPQILPNSARLGRFVYDRTRDTVRGVSQHVVVGRVTRAGHPLDAWFVLCRAGD